eukprot:1489972-Amphidinium_carterae.1
MSWCVLDVLQEELVLLRLLLLEEQEVKGCGRLDVRVGTCGARSGGVALAVDVDVVVGSCGERSGSIVVMCTRCARGPGYLLRLLLLEEPDVDVVVSTRCAPRCARAAPTVAI